MSKCILIAVSEKFRLKEYELALRANGFRVLTASTGLACIDLVHQVIPDLIVLDTELLWGGADGVVAVIAEDPSLPMIPVMLISPKLHRTVLYALSRFGVSDYQTKPWSAERLVHRVRALTQPDLSHAGS